MRLKVNKLSLNLVKTKLVHSSADASSSPVDTFSDASFLDLRIDNKIDSPYTCKKTCYSLITLMKHVDKDSGKMVYFEYLPSLMCHDFAN